MRFWDTSAIAALLVEEPRSAIARELLQRDEQLAVWWSTPVECWSALSRLRRDGVLDQDAERASLGRLDVLRSVWHEISPSEEVRVQARRLLRVHRLRAADALQLAAAVVWSGMSAHEEFVSFDERLRVAADAEGFLVV